MAAIFVISLQPSGYSDIPVSSTVIRCPPSALHIQNGMARDRIAETVWQPPPGLYGCKTDKTSVSHQLSICPVIVHCHQGLLPKHNSRQFPVIKHIAGVNCLYEFVFLTCVPGPGCVLHSPSSDPYSFVVGCHYGFKVSWIARCVPD